MIKISEQKNFYFLEDVFLTASLSSKGRELAILNFVSSMDVSAYIYTTKVSLTVAIYLDSNSLKVVNLKVA